jgi:MoaA/NifB/PqqE/SkfB family radical SAM enzyme
MQELKLITSPDTSLLEQYNLFEVTSEDEFVTIDWNMGNTCNYSCTYCDDYFNNGSISWTDEDVAFEFVKRCTDHYKSIGKKVLWNLLGGEPTVWKNFSSFFKRVKQLDPECRIRVLTNGSRTLNWWKKTAPILDDIVISFHPESADIEHCSNVSAVLRDAGVFHSIQICLYPPHLDKCYEAAEYFHANARCNVVIIKSLRLTLASSETFVYEQDYLDRILRFDGEPKWTSEFLDGDSKANPYAKNLKFISNSDELHVSSANELMRKGQNTWKGWNCNIGIETLVVEMNGRVTSGSSCNHETDLGNINDPSNIEFPTKPTVCQWTWCSCIADVETTKYRIE